MEFRASMRPHLGLSAVINQSPDQLLALSERATDDALRVSSKVQCFAPVWGCLDESMICWGLQSLFSICGAAVDDRTCKFAGVPKTSTGQ